MDDGIDDTVRAMLRELNAGFPAVETMTAPRARAAVARRGLGIDPVRPTVNQPSTRPGE